MEAGREPARAPTPQRLLSLAVVLLIAGLVSAWGVDLGRRVIGVSKGESGPAISQQLAAAELALARTTAERDALEEKLKAAPTAAGTGNGELAQLQADLALLDTVLPPARAGAGLVIRGMQARMASPKLLHYTVLLQYGAKKKGPSAFAGRLTLAVTVEQDGKSTVLAYPQDGGERYDLTVERYQRVDGTLELPEGAKAGTVKVSLSENGKVVATEATTVRSL